MCRSDRRIERVRRSRTLLATTILAVHSRPPTFPAFDGHTQCMLFPTDFSSTMPSADCPSAMGSPCGSLTAECCDSFVFPHSRAHAEVRNDSRHAVGFDKPVPTLPAFFSAEPGALPGYSRLLSMRNRWIYVMRHSGNCRTSGCVAPSSLCIPPQIRFLYVSPRLCLRPPQGLLSENSFAFGYTLRRYLAGSGL